MTTMTMKQYRMQQDQLTRKDRGMTRKVLAYLAEGFKWEKKASREDVATVYAEHKQFGELHSSIIDQGRKVQIAASGESKYGAMSDSDFIEWALNLLEGKDV